LAILTGLYWLGLGTVKLLHPILIGWRLTKLPEGHGSISAAFGDFIFRVTMTQDGAVVWAGQAHLAAVLGWVLGPPVLLYAAWRASRDDLGAEQASLGSRTDPALPAPSLGDRLAAEERELAARRRSGPADRSR
jgi:hypothetical protein